MLKPIQGLHAGAHNFPEIAPNGHPPGGLAGRWVFASPLALMGHGKLCMHRMHVLGFSPVYIVCCQFIDGVCNVFSSDINSTELEARNPLTPLRGGYEKK